jgi:dTDP-4-dehydro-6-deoxy-alpha-D-glucopyranose 2,3-dehydratase
MKNIDKITENANFFFSSLTLKNRFQKFEAFLSWFERKKTDEQFIVNEIPFSKFDQWDFSENNASIIHKSGKFFRIEGIRVQTNFGGKKKWEQPIINQPEIGILGILTKVFNGTLYFLMQAKMEPGNVNILQLSPTVQATKSNFSRVHNGKLPAYLDYFIESSKSEVLIDQLQTEQGARFLWKRNRNIVIRVEEDIEILPDFCWLTLGEIKKLLEFDNFVNMDARSVISTIPLIDDSLIAELHTHNWEKGIDLTINGININSLNLDLIKSVCCEKCGYKTTDQIISWYTSMKVNYELEVETIPLSQIKNWKITENNIYNNERYFSVIGVEVIAGTREVTSWTQPLIKDLNIGLLGFLTKKINGTLHFLVQAKVEPGNMDIIELSPTVSCSNIAYKVHTGQFQPKFFEYFINHKDSRIMYDTLQSEEGGRFYHLQNKNMIVEISETVDLDLPENYIWMTLNQMMDFMKYSMFNIEARSLVSCLNFLTNDK